jgi:hypothetical protein
LAIRYITELDDHLPAICELEDNVVVRHFRLCLVKGGVKHDILSRDRTDDYGLPGFGSPD